MTSNPRDEIVDHVPSMRAFARSLTRDVSSADDLVQETVVKAWSNIDKFQAGTNMRAWLFTILRNTFYTMHRKRSREVADPDGDMVAALSVKPAHDGRLVMRDFAKAFLQLPDDQREALALVGASGFSYEEAAQMCGCAVGTIKSRTNRARRKLAELMHLDDNEPLEMTDSATMAVVTGRPAA